MRPRSNVLFWCGDEEVAALTRYIVSVRLDRIRLIECSSEDLSRMVCRMGPRSVLLVRADAQDGCAELIESLRDAAVLPTPVMVWDPQATLNRSGAGHQADLVERSPLTMALLESLRIISARKPGPRKKQPGREWLPVFAANERCA